MLRALNLPDFTDQAKQFILSSHTEALVVWTPNMATTMANGPTYDSSPWYTPSWWNDNVPADVRIEWAHKHNIKVLMVMDSTTPPWAYKYRQAAVGHGPDLNAWGNCFPPDDLTESGPWAQCVEFALKRHPNTYALIVGNEPNLNWSQYPHRYRAAARTICTAAQIAKRVGYPRLLAWGIEDDENHEALPFLEGALSRLNSLRTHKLLTRRWRPPKGVSVGVAWHPYTDVSSVETARVTKALRQVKDRLYRGNAGLWCTEGGYVYAMKKLPGPYLDGPDNGKYFDYIRKATDEVRQQHGVKLHYRWAERNGLGCWANYQYQEDGWAGWASGLVDKNGKSHPILADWPSL